jgi:signal transduction histidine kinase
MARPRSDTNDEVLEQITTIMESISDPFIAFDRDWRVRFINGEGEKFLRTDRARIVGRKLQEAFPLQPVFFQKCREAMESGQTVEFEDHFPRAGVWYHVIAYPSRLGVSVHMRDVTARRRADEVRERQGRMVQLRGDVSDALSKEGTLAEMLQQCADALVTHLGLVRAEISIANAEGEDEVQGSAGSDGAGIERQFELRAVDEHIGVVALFAPEPIEDEVVLALRTVADTITQGIRRKRAEDELADRARELARSNADLEQFAYAASHDLQEPLRMVASFTQLLARRYQDKLDSDANEFIGFAVDGVNRMHRLINDLLVYSRVERRGKELVPVSLARVLERALGNLKLTLDETGAEVQAPVELPMVLGDDVQLEMLLQNLIGNAIKFRSPARKPEVTVSATRSGSAGMWEIVVRDNGIGIEPQYFDRIFVIFQRLHAVNEYPGTGIGLALGKKIVERHGGTIWVESTLGVGTAFHFTLPALPRTSAPG